MTEEDKVRNIYNGQNGLSRLRSMGYVVTLDGKVWNKDGKPIKV